MTPDTWGLLGAISYVSMLGEETIWGKLVMGTSTILIGFFWRWLHT